MACLSEDISNETILTMQGYLINLKESFISVVDKNVFGCDQSINKDVIVLEVDDILSVTNGLIRKKNLQQTHSDFFASHVNSGLFRIFMNEFISTDATKCTQLAKYEKKVRKVEEAYAIVCDKWCR